MAELHTWEEVEKKASEFKERFGYEPAWYGHVDDVYEKLVESLETGEPMFDQLREDVML